MRINFLITHHHGVPLTKFVENLIYELFKKEISLLLFSLSRPYPHFDFQKMDKSLSSQSPNMRKNRFLEKKDSYVRYILLTNIIFT